MQETPVSTSREPTPADPVDFIPQASGGTGWAEGKVRRVLEGADVRIGGDRPWDMQVWDSRLYRRLVMDGMVGLGDSYVDGWWDCAAVDQLFERLLRADVQGRLAPDRHAVWDWVRQRVLNLQTRRRARRNIESHYHLGQDLFEATLDRRMLYTCGYWRDAKTLDEAQEAKLELICRKLRLRPGQRVLDIGCGWGSFEKYAAERYGVEVVGLTISTEQLEPARRACRGLPVEIRLQDYRDVRERFDHVVSVGCLEHVGPKNYRAFMETAHRCLPGDGLFLLHFFAGKRSFPNLHDTELAWITRRIFPGGVVPSMKQVFAAMDGLFVVEDLHNFGADYEPTLLAWFENFDRNWPAVSQSGRYDERFYRMWKLYLLMSAAAFRVRKYWAVQVVLSREGVRGGYDSVR